WTRDAYDRVLEQVCRLLRPGGRFIFSVNVPEPSWGQVARVSILGLFRARRPLKFLQRGWRMMSYGGWLKRQARQGRFHYLALPSMTRGSAAVFAVASPAGVIGPKVA